MKKKLQFKYENTKKVFSAEDLVIVSFFLLLTAGLFLSFAIPLRPSESQSEKRTLSTFPDFSVQALFGGSYFKEIDLWFSDTFPMREQFISANSTLKRLYGFNAVQISGKIEDGDDIPDAPTRPAVVTTSPASTAPATTAPAVVSTNPPDTTKPAVTEKTQDLNGVLISGNQGYEYYNFVKNTADRYAAAVSKTASKLQGFSTVYDIIPPTGIGIIISDKLKHTINSSDQEKAIKYMYGSMSENVKTVNLYDTLTAHKAEYIYFRTDHHWTGLGAYYGYEQFAKAKGISPIPLSKYEEITFDGFLGSFYSETKKSPLLAKKPDTVVAYKPFNDTTMKYVDSKGNTIDWSVICDVSNWNENSKYNTFIGGDNPYTTIRNKDLTDGSSCLVIKESFGNAFVPFLVAHYQFVRVIDYRYWNGNPVQFAKDNKIKDVIFINNISATRNESLVSTIEKLVAK